MTILSVMQSAALRLVGYKPSVFFASSETFESEIVDLINEAAEDIVDYQDWQALITQATLTGDGTTEAFNLPEGYSRMMLTADVQDTNNYVWGYQAVNSVDEYIWMKARGWGPYPGVWSIFNNQFNFYPVPAAGQLAVFPYISKNYAKSQDGTFKPAFTADTDEFRINGAERLLTLWLVWRWRENKKLDATGDQENFAKALDELAAKDRGSRVIRSRSRSVWGNVRTAWPYQLG